MTQNEQTELLREMRDLLRVIAEPSLSKRDEARRAALLKIVGKSSARAKAVMLMDGSRTQTIVGKESGVDSGNMSRLATALRQDGLLTEDEKRPKLVIPVPSNLFDSVEKKNG